MGVATRTKTGVMVKAKYDNTTLRLLGERRSHDARGTLSKRIIKMTKIDKCKGKAFEEPKPDLGFEAKELDRSLPYPNIVDITGGVDFIPPTAFGEIHEGASGMGLSAIGRANRKIEQWEIIRAAHAKHLPKVLPQIDERLREAREARNLIEDNETNNSVINIEKRKQKISDRIAVLKRGLESSRFEPEAENVRGAIAAYQSGQIGYTDQYTLIWAGKVVGKAAAYADFTKDRQARLDRYSELHGPHWLWWESPLMVRPEAAPRASLCAEIQRVISATGLGQYFIQQCYWKRAEWVMRMPSVVATGARTAIQPQNQETSTTGGLSPVYCQSEGPKLVYTSLLDSGATYPSLHPYDFHELGIDVDQYGAQTIETFNTANGVMNSRVFELHVTVLNNNFENLVDPNDAVWPYHGKYLGGLCPVSMCSGAPNEPDPEGRMFNHRLSGLLPFLACYVTFTPCRNRMFLGENRNDVMGGHKTPGQRRWDIAMPSTQPISAETWPKYGNPKIRFTHRGGQIVDEDSNELNHVSSTTFLAGTAQETVVVNNPRMDCDQAQAKRQEEAFLAEPVPLQSIGDLDLDLVL